VTVLAGPDEDKYDVHHTRLVQHSAYFRKLLAGSQSDEAPVVVNVPGISATYFEMYCHWVYTSELDYEALDYDDGAPCFVELNSRLQEETDEGEREHLLDAIPEHSSILADHLIRFWIHADHFEDAKCQNTISDELTNWFFNEYIPTSISPSTIAFVDKQTRPGCPLRQFCIDWVDSDPVVGSKRSKRECLGEKAPKWLLLGLLSAKMRREEGEWEEEGDPREASKKGRYYVHHVDDM
jgi:hypothetical protein